nr:STT3 domain-containing protein [uncultured Sulfurimonas sp.]
MNLTKETKTTLLYITIAFLFSVAMRMIWVSQFSGYEAFMFNNQFMINTNDGYIWAEGARDLLSGTGTNPDAQNFYDKFHQLNDLSPVSSAASGLTALLVYILPFSFESIIFYMPIFLSSLLVIPIILIAKSIDNLEMGFIAALLASIAWSYYNRTMIGYYDTDMLNIVLPMFLLWSIIWAIKTNEDKYLLITALDILVYRWWYPQSYALEFAFFGLILFYALVFDRKNLYNYKLLAIMMFAMLNIDGFIRFPIVLAVLYVFKQDKYQKYIYHILALSILAFFATGGFDPIWGQLKNYVFKDAIESLDKGLNLHFYSVMQTIREAGQIPFETFANRISGHTITLILSIVGYIYLSYKHKIMLFGLPMVGLGFLALVGGLRFTIYAVPVLALGVAFLITQISLKMPTTKLKYLSMIAFTLMILYPNYKHIESYRVPTVFNSDEVKVLDKLKDIASREDYVVSWWDYGYPIRYYSDVKTLADGGKHSGSVNFPLSFMLNKPQDLSAKMARLDVEYTEIAFKVAEKNKDLNESQQIKRFSNIEEMTKEYGFNDTNDFLLSLETDIKLPNKTRDIYFFLPYRMLSIFPTVSVFSNLDLMSGKQNKAPFFFISRDFQETKNTLELGSGVSLDKKNNTITIGKDKVALRRVVNTLYDKNMQLQKSVQLRDFKAPLSLIYMADYKTFLLLDEKTYNSLYIQLMVLEEYDKNLFEKVITNPHAKVYKLKI